jgi:uncharacterized protein (PEP-CTERM system associated)
VNLDYSIRELLYGQHSRGNQTQQALNAMGSLEAIEKFLYVDMSGVISQQAISAFGVQSPANYSINDNLTETSNFRISPYVKGKLAGYADYEGRYSRSRTHSKSSAVQDTDIDEWRGVLKGDTRFARLNWQLDVGRQNYDYNRGRQTESDNWHGLLGYGIAADWKISVSIGQERNDFVSLNKQTWQTHGYGFDWKPNERTELSAFREKRFFGHGHSLNISHRLARSALKFSDTRDIAALPNQLSAPGLGTIYDLLFAQFASVLPDEGNRADYLSKFLQQNGISPNALVFSGFFGSQVTARRRQEFSYVLRGARNTVTVGINRSKDDSLGVGGGSGDLALTPSITQRGVSLTYSHQLSAVSALNVNGSHTRNSGSSLLSLSQQVTQKMLSAGISTRLSAKTNAAVTARRTVFDSQTAPYTENALVGTLTVQF